MKKRRLAVLASGGGSNLQAILGHARRLGGRCAYEVVLVASDRPDAGALRRARDAGVDTAVVSSIHAPDAPPMDVLLKERDVELVALAGYLKLVPPEVTRRFAGALLNVHPALLPGFGGAGMYGARVHRAVVAAKAGWSGPTVHFVDEVYDHGALIAQWRVPVLPGDDERTLAARVLRAEHLLYPRIIQLVASGGLKQRDVAGAGSPGCIALLPPFDPFRTDEEQARVLDTELAHLVPMPSSAADEAMIDSKEREM